MVGDPGYFRLIHPHSRSGVINTSKRSTKVTQSLPPPWSYHPTTGKGIPTSTEWWCEKCKVGIPLSPTLCFTSRSWGKFLYWVFTVCSESESRGAGLETLYRLGRDSLWPFMRLTDLSVHGSTLNPSRCDFITVPLFITPRFPVETV